MQGLYVETSCVLAWLFGEPKSDKYIKIIDSAESVLTSTLTVMEVERGLTRALTQSRITASDQLRLLGLFRSAVAGWIVIEISKNVREQVGKAFPREPIRTLDAIHLSTVLMLVSAFPDIQLLTNNDRVSLNAQAMGLKVVEFRD